MLITKHTKVARLFNQCRNEAKKSNVLSRHCAGLEKGGKLYYVCCNQYSVPDGTKHAEEVCINKFKPNKHNNKKFNLFVIRINTLNEYVMSKPCKHCIKLIQLKSFIKKIYYSKNLGEFNVENVLRISNDYVSTGKRRFLKKRNTGKRVL